MLSLYMMKLTFICLYPPSSEAWCHLHVHIFYTGVILIHKVPLHHVKVGVWWTVNAKQLTGPIFYA